MNGKGDKQRKMAISRSEWEKRWERVFLCRCCLFAIPHKRTKYCDENTVSS